MSVCAGLVELWCLLLVSMFGRSTQDGSHKQTGVLLCVAENMTLSVAEKRIQLQWEDGPGCRAGGGVLLYQLEVLVGNQQLYQGPVPVPPDQLGFPHNWSWSSPLALECASHTVRIRSRLGDQSGPLQEEHTPPGAEALKEPAVYPKVAVFEVGSRATFCCVLPAGQSFHSFYLSGYGSRGNINVLGPRLISLTINLTQHSGVTFTDAICQTDSADNGAAVYIGYPPDDRDLLCETRDLESVECVWTVGRNTHIALKSPTLYQLQGSPCAEGHKGKCSTMIQPNSGVQSWTLTATNQLGMKQLTDRADPLRRVWPWAPVDLVLSKLEAREAFVNWSWGQQPSYRSLPLRCQLQLHPQHQDLHTAAAAAAPPLHMEASGRGLEAALLRDLIPDWSYTVRIRCGTRPHLWRWSEWSSSLEFRTPGDVPDALDVWMQRTDCRVTIMWKELPANQSHGRILDYQVSWSPAKEPQRVERRVVSGGVRLTTLEASRELSVSVSARNHHGSSTPSSITVAPLRAEAWRLKWSRMVADEAGFLLSWAPSPAATCGFVLQWCPLSGAPSLDWLKVPPHVSSARLPSGSFREGQRYELLVFGCRRGLPPLLLQRWEGYIRETRIPEGLFGSVQWQQRGWDVELQWERVALREQSAFILGYNLHCRDLRGQLVANASTDQPEASSLTLRNLAMGSYTLTLTARTALGECGASSVSATLNSLTDDLVQTVFISLLSICALLSLAGILCYRHWACIRRKVYPPIPQPVLRDHWLTPLGAASRYPMAVQRSPSSSIVVPQLIPKTVEPEQGVCVSQDHNNTHTHAHSHTPHDSITRPARDHPPRPQPPRGGIFPNPTYDVMVQTESHLWADGGGGGGGGYHPQTPPTAPGSPMSVVSEYMPLPCSPSEH